MAGDKQINYGRICIPSALLKIFNSLLNNRVQDYCRLNNIINNIEIRFTTNHCTIVEKYVTIAKINFCLLYRYSIGLGLLSTNVI